MTDPKPKNQVDIKAFLSSFKETLRVAFHERDNIESFVQKRGFPALVLRDIMAANPLSVAIPSEYGGRGCKVKECLGLLETASYESLPLTLTFGINIALFLEPVAKYAQDSIKPQIFNRFLKEKNMGGLMITEPDYGSDALNMQTSNTLVGDKYHIKGIKHWQGLTGMADYWIMTSRNLNDKGNLGRDLDLFVTDEHDADQRIIVEEYFNNLGLYPIPYGKNLVDIMVPQEYKLVPETTGLKMLIDTLHRSRYQFAGMGMGFIKRMLDEAIAQCNRRYVGGKPLMALDQVKFQISKIQSAYTICSGMCHHAAKYSSIATNLSGDIVEANSIKAYLTDLMQECAQTLTQLCGANGYKLENVGARGIIDSRPFQIFEGSNEMLYTQIAEVVLKQMRRKKESNFYSFLNNFEKTELASEQYRKILDFNITENLSQRKVIELGKIISRVVASNHVINLGEEGFRSDLIRDCFKLIRQDISNLLNAYKTHTDVDPIEDYHGESAWLDFAK